MRFNFFAFVILIANSIYAQNLVDVTAQELVPDAQLVIVDKESNSIRFMEFSSKKATFTEPFDVTIKKALKFPEYYNLKVKSETKDSTGNHIRYQVTAHGIPVENMTYIAHLRDNRLEKANGNYKILSAGESRPVIDNQTALKIAIAHSKAQEFLWETPNALGYTKPQAELVYLVDNDKLRICYKVDIFSTKPHARNYYYIDALSGELVKIINRIRNNDTNGTAVTRYNGTRSITTDFYNSLYRLRESGRTGGIETYDLNNSVNTSNAEDFTDSDNFWNTTTNMDDAAYDAHFGTEITYDYYLNTHGRHSYDNANGKLISYVHYDYGYANAFWDGSCMTYGDGDGIEFGPLTSIDVVAHEITHGVTEHSANLEYWYESGALNESFSDIFGVAVDFYANPTTANFYMGDQFDLLHGKGFRNMANPNEFQNPDTYQGDFWEFSSYDNGGVHINSGVQNFWFYLLCMGGSGTNDNGDNYSVQAIGMEKAARIAYRMLTVYLTETSDYEDARYFAIQSATDIYGNCSHEVKNVTDAWYAVGVGESYNGFVTADFDCSQTQLCTSPNTVLFYNKSINGSAYEWNFGDGTTSTAEHPQHTYLNNGTYNVRLIASGVSHCNNRDTLLINSYITVSNSGKSVVNPECRPKTQNNSSGGIFGVKFGKINIICNGSEDNYKDYSCSDTTGLIEGRRYPFEINLGTAFKQNVKVWIDFNNNGSLAADELIYSKMNTKGTVVDSLIIPQGLVYDGQSLRLRMIADQADVTIVNACHQPEFGQVIDFAVLMFRNNSKPITDFVASKRTIINGDTVQFTDISQNFPVSWNWSFPGGTPSSSMERNPKVVYNNTGEYNVTLTTHNAYGSDTKTMSGYINSSSPAPSRLRAKLSDYETGTVNLTWQLNASSTTSVIEDFEDGLAQNLYYSTPEAFDINEGVLQFSTIYDEVMESAYYDNDFGNFSFDFSFRATESQDDFYYGAFFRADGPVNFEDANGYLFWTTYGAYSVWRFENGEYYNLIPWTESQLLPISSNEWVVVTIEVQGDESAIFINDEFLDSFIDPTFASGTIGLVNLNITNQGQLEWDNLSIEPLSAGIKSIAKPRINPNRGTNTDFFNGRIDAFGKAPSKIGRSKNLKTKTSTTSLVNFNVYRNDLLVGNTAETTFSDVLTDYGTYDYFVKAVYPDEVSQPSNIAKITWVEALPGDHCGNAQNLSDLVSPYSGSTIGYENDFNLCSNSAPDRVFYIDVPVGRTLTIGQASNSYDSRHMLMRGDICPGSETIVCQDDPDVETYQYTNTTDEVQRLYWIQAGFSGYSGSFILEWYLDNPTVPIADFSSNKTIVGVGGHVAFTDLSIGIPDSWSWQFEGGSPSVSTDQNPIVTYNAIGTYNVSLTVENDLGQDTKILVDYITVTEVEPGEPGDQCHNAINLGKITSPYSSTTFGLNDDYDGCGAESPDRMFFVDVPAGESFTIWQVTNDYDSQHSLRTGGSCPGSEVISCVDDPDDYVLYYFNNTTETKRVYYIQDGFWGSSGNFTIAWELTGTPCPIADFWATDTEINANNHIQFWDNSLGSPDNWNWIFEGGSPNQSSDQNPYIYYANPGNYRVKLIVGNVSGTDSLTREAYITVDGPVASSNVLLQPLTAYPNPGNGKFKLSLEGVSSNDLIKIEIKDVAGRKLQDFNPISGINNMAIDISSFAAGMYLIEVYSKKGTSVVRYVLNESK